MDPVAQVDPEDSTPESASAAAVVDTNTPSPNAKTDAASAAAQKEERDVVFLVELVQKDESEAAFEQLYNKFRLRLLGIVSQQLREWDLHPEAQDVTQESFVEAWIRINSLRDPSKFFSFLSAIAYHKCVDRLRKIRGREVPLEGEVLDALMGEAGSVDFRNVLMEEEEFKILREAILRLKCNESDVIMSFLNGMNGPAVAKKLNMTVDQVNGIRRRVVEKLRGRITEVQE